MRHFLVVPLFVSIVAAIVLHYAITQYFNRQAKEQLENILLSDRGFHQYIQRVMHPAFFKAMQNGDVDKKYYAPEVLSSSYIVREMHALYNEERVKKGLPPVYYKMAANNPRNPVNKADEREAKLIKLFNENRALKESEEIVTVQGKKYLYYAIPFLKNEKRCMRCHGNPEDAPSGLRLLYPGGGGFHEKLGEIRAVESMRIPIEQQGYMAFMIAGSAGSGLFAIVILFFFNSSLRQRVSEKTKSLEIEIQERKKSEEQLRASEENFRTLFDKSADAIFLVRPDGTIADVNSVACERYKYTKEELLAMTVTQIDTPRDSRNAAERIGRVMRYGRAVFEAEHRTKGGEIIPVEVNARLIMKGSQAFLLATCRDITERKKSEEAIAAEKERLAVTLRSIGDGVIVTDTEGKITLLNKVAEELTGWTGEEGTGRPLSEVFNIINEETRQPCENPVDQALRSGFTVGLANHTALIKRDGTEIIIADSAAPIRDRESRIIGVVLVFRDISVQYRTEAEMRKLQKLESLGILAGGLAHDFNNLLTGIKGNVELAGLQLDQGRSPRAYLTQAERAMERATGLTRQLLTFAKGGEPIKRKTRIDELARESVDFALHGSNVKCAYTVPEGLWKTEVDTGQMSQVFNNLIINAVQAMPHGGTAHISFENVSLTENQIPPLPNGDYMKVVFQDEGEGIAEEHLSKIFDPYFTTKEQGSGLGLAVVFSIINRHNGHLTVESKPGEGTTFSLYLPASKGTSRDEQREEACPVPGQGKILVMDDEEMVRNVTGQMLDALGYKVEFAYNGEQAVELYTKARDKGTPFSAVIVDLTIRGGMGGQETAKRLLGIDPGAKVIVSSGYSTAPVMSRYREHGFKGVIVKPFSIAQLSKTLSRVLTA
ncbi:MAG TPA: PAS domain S-box protein [Dissulfurispiraceae bacterium]